MRIPTGLLALQIIASMGAALFAQSDPPPAADPAPAAQSGDSGQVGDYTGPAILSRSSILGNFGVPRSIRFRPFAAINGIYDSQFTGVTVQPDGTVPRYGLYGFQATAGISGSKATERTAFSVNYRGSYIDYGNRTFYSGTNQFLSLGLTHRISKHISVSFQEGASTYSRSFDVSYLGNYTSLAYLNNPATEIFDGRTYFLSSTGNVIVRKSARLSFNAGATAFEVQRRSSALSSVRSWMAFGDVNYRLTRRINTGLYYRFTHYGYLRQFGSTDFHTVGLNLSGRLSRRWELALQAGASRVEFLGLSQIPVDPVIAAITGRSYGLIALYRLTYASDGGVRLTRTMRRGTLAFLGGRSINPGNGLYLTSNYTSAAVTYDYGGFRRWNLNFRGEYGEYGAISQGLRPFRAWIAGVGASRSLRHGLSSFLRANYRYVDVTDSLFRRNQFTVSIGLAFSPGDRPLALW